MSTFTRFAIVGAGGVGGVVARELLKKNLAVTILTRDDSKVCFRADGFRISDRWMALTYSRCH